MKMEMTQFQKRVLERLEPIESHAGISLKRCEDKRPSDSDLYLISDNPRLKIWIYGSGEFFDYGVAYEFGNIDLQCEQQDFNTEDEMIEFFFGSLATALRMQGWR